MRLIDADALYAQIQQDYDIFADSTYLPDKARRDELNNVMAHIINAPIVEAELVKCGKWINLYSGNYKCSNCGSWWSGEKREVVEAFNYCPNCGTKMAGPIWKWKND